ncbi:hypothetical protein TrispH2_010329 [Trichoplax sp. H2]|nr:hypothetical protein TrispH2_010329 [Trichoplax sp. H2]|eukprot:RDD39716.1 hypothetical protein TrispH2_010329 [Trichoplax sp. H2]
MAKSSIYKLSFNIDPKEHFFQIANTIGLDWTKLAATLDQSIDVDSIKDEESGIFDQAMKFLKKWHKKNYPNVHVDQLQAALRRIDRNDIALAIKPTKT